MLIILFCCSLVSGASYAEESVGAPHFAIREFDIAGNSKIASESLTTAVMPFLGEDQSFTSIQAAVSAIKQAYKEAGYEMVRVVIPKQTIASGIVHLQVVETRITKINIKGNQHFDEANILRSLTALKVGESVNIENLATDLRLANENNAKHTQVKFNKDEETHEVDAEIDVSDTRPWHLATSIDNTGNDSTGNWRWGLAFLHNNVLNRDHALSGQFVTSPDHINDVQILGLNYRIPLYGIGDEVLLNVNHSSVNSGVVNTTDGNYGISGSGDSAGAHYLMLLPKFMTIDQRLNFGFDYRYFHNSVTFIGSSQGSIVPDVEVHPLSLAYSGLFRQVDQEIAAMLGVYQNLPGGSFGDTAAMHASRAQANPAYTIFRYSLNYNQNLPANWQLKAAFNGQQTNDALISGEQFGIGGVYSVRGFQERSLANDKGYRTSVELYTPDFGNIIDLFPVKLRALVFFNAASVSRNDALLGENSKGHLSSIGLGFRGAIANNMQIRLDLTNVLDTGGLSSVGQKHAQASLIYMY